MKTNRIFLFRKVIVVFYISVAVISFCIGLGFLLFPGGEGWVITLMMSTPAMALVFWLFAIPAGGYIVKNNDQNFSETSKQETKDLEDYSALWKTKEIIPVAYTKQNTKQLREMLGEEVWKEKYKGT